MLYRRLALLSLPLSALACSIFLGGPALPPTSDAGSADGAPSLQSEIESAVAAAAADGTFQVSLSQDQLTAFLRSRLPEQDGSVLTDPQVVLTGGRMIVYGRTKAWLFEANAATTIQFSVSSDGAPEIAISDAEWGPWPMPQALRDAIAAALDEAVTGVIGPALIGFRLESIEISEGDLTLAGRLR